MHNSKEIDLPNLFGSKIIEEAKQLLLAADKDGSVPMFITQNLKKIAQGLGVEITSDQTPEVVINNIREKIKVIQDDEWEGIPKIEDKPAVEEKLNNPKNPAWFDDIPKKDTSKEHVVDFAWDDVPNGKTPFESDTEVVDSAKTSPSLNTDNKIFKLSPEDRKKLLDASLAATEKASKSIGKSKQLLAQLNSTNNEPVLPSSTEQVNVSKITPISEIENVAEKTNIDDAKNKKVAQEESHLKEDAGHTASSTAKLKLGLNTVAGSLLWAKNISNEVNEINTGEKKIGAANNKRKYFCCNTKRTTNRQPCVYKK